MSPGMCFINSDISPSQSIVTVTAVLQMLYTYNRPLPHQLRHYPSHLHFPLLPLILPLCHRLHQPDELRFKLYMLPPLIIAMSAIQVLSLSAHVHITRNLHVTRSPCILPTHAHYFA